MRFAFIFAASLLRLSLSPSLWIYETMQILLFEALYHVISSGAWLEKSYTTKVHYLLIYLHLPFAVAVDFRRLGSATDTHRPSAYVCARDFTSPTPPSLTLYYFLEKAKEIGYDWSALGWFHCHGSIFRDLFFVPSLSASVRFASWNWTRGAQASKSEQAKSNMRTLET